MPLLKDYLGSLVSGINQARAMADLESAKIAEAYVSNPLLKHFSVPRFKASNIELDIPVAIDELEEVEEVNYQPIDNKSFNSFAYNAVKDAVKETRFDRKTSEVLRREISQATQHLEKRLKAKEDITKSLHYYANSVADFYTKNSKAINLEEENHIEVTALNDATKHKIVRMLNERLIDKIKAPKRSVDMDSTKVLVQAHQLKGIPENSIVRIKMTLVEDGMEWQTIEKNDGEVVNKLLPE